MVVDLLPPGSPQQQRKARQLLLFLLATVILLEAATQVRSHFRTGQSIWNQWTGKTTYVTDELLGIKVLRPNAIIRGSKGLIVSNSLGLRSDEIPQQPSPGELRIAVLGASTVMGTYSRDNADTFPAQIQSQLRSRYPSRTINVINGGIAGFGLREQAILLEKRLLPLLPSLLVIYPGGHDFTS